MSDPIARAGDPIDPLVIQLRAYVASPRRPSRRRGDRRWTSGIVVIFDTETFTDPSQRLRFGVYQVRQDGQLIEAGLFHSDEPDPQDLADLRAAASQVSFEGGVVPRLMSRSEFVERAIFKWGLEVGGLIVGFNLPFDLSRIAIDHTFGKGTMKGGFSFTLADGRPNVRVKHLSQRAAFINFAGKGSDDKAPDRGFFVDVKTLAAAQTGQSHSLQSLTRLLKVKLKTPLYTYEGPLSPEMVTYCADDVQATWECFSVLAKRYGGLGLRATGMNDLYSEASLGKAYLTAMGIKPWTEVQPDFPPELIGQAMSTYYGGRAEVHIRREIVPVIHCDFLSMYPTVCTLMRLWPFVIADGMTWHQATEEVRSFVEACSLARLRDPKTWQELHCIVQVLPEGDVFPVRANYDPDKPATIGVNRLTSREPMWFTLADVLAAKVLGGECPKILSAIRFSPGEPQAELREISLAGATVRPEVDDFYALLIDQRRRVQALEDVASEEERAAHTASQKGLKILANSTSYGIFVELNVQQLDRRQRLVCYDFRGKGRTVTASKVEEPGRYFHPLLGSLITGAARLMLALAERNALDQGLGWAFCDTDSLAVANTTDLPLPEFIERVHAVRAYFEPLNPYEVKGSILQLEKVNFPPGENGNLQLLRPVNCLAVSAKRYVLFDRNEQGEPVIRKASAHGLGHLLPPYKDPDGKRVERIGVQLWQEDLWVAIIKAYDQGRPDQPDLSAMAGLDQPAATRYAVTNQTLLAWFKGFNAKVLPAERVGPFNFLLTYQAKSRLEVAATDPDALHTRAWRRRSPKPASRYSSDLAKDMPEVFDRESGEPIARDWLRSYRRALADHHLHSETKFRGGEGDEHGTLERRHVEVWAVIPIGKEADNLEERETFGADDGDAIEWSMSREERARLIARIEDVLSTYRLSDRALAEVARVSHHTVSALRKGRRVTSQSMMRLTLGCEQLRREAEAGAQRAQDWLEFAKEQVALLGGGNKLADRLGISRPYLHRVLNQAKPLSRQMIDRLKAMHRYSVVADT